MQFEGVVLPINIFECIREFLIAVVVLGRRSDSLENIREVGEGVSFLRVLLRVVFRLDNEDPPLSPYEKIDAAIIATVNHAPLVVLLIFRHYPGHEPADNLLDIEPRHDL